jgi:hypothetical protein
LIQRGRVHRLDAGQCRAIAASPHKQVCTIAFGYTAVSEAGRPLRAVTDQEEDVGNTPVLGLGQHGQPVLRRLTRIFTGSCAPQFTMQIHPDHYDDLPGRSEGLERPG